ncbi:MULTISPECIES: FadR/GntR family transcriptional regulator [Streptomyces]|uniref:FadR family transcriptional regulator n=2 Tax=Streptomyces TaxID=1883 RepID=A0A3R7ENT4_9ACTN|nr:MULTISPECIES: GntR family transcriptional regulator [Streptomyces]KNE82040.1 fatty acid metabolism transcriptional regulator FadR [Streptomyces fradiae]OFA49567.1 FadR family transcriptional regulator [Streptomyces fradiae]PQM21680.1 FadR family transcriptional regulator [Streptomyces xinghaiensis]RKM93113.1 FadR family transcriptional regulator [Streptomyces xinghaiensis]RNC71290.1 FadR family transcriptional regulator [Streptomyces xinghaiensis]
MEALPRQTIVDVLEDRLREDILAGRHPVGDYLPPERELAHGYGVTRTTLKHAFGRLVQAGLLETRHGVGTRVRDYARLGGADLLPMLVRHSSGWIGEVFEVRRAVGALIAERAAVRATAAQRDGLRALLAAVAAAEGADAVQLADVEVHRALARATGNRVYVLLTNTLFQAYLPIRSALAAPFGDPAAAHGRLAPVVEAVVAGDGGAAHAAAGEYLAATERIMLAGEDS